MNGDTTMKYECRKWYDSHGTGNYTEDKGERFSMEITTDRAKAFADLWTAIGAKHYETSKAYFFEKDTDATHYTQYIIYK